MRSKAYVSTTNACRPCMPLGAALAFRGIAGGMPFLHGSQGCATYMRRYVISHFREPMDVASSSLGEKNAIYGGGANLKKGILNVIKKYNPRLIGVASTCLTETIGDDLGLLLSEFKSEFSDPDLPEIVFASTPSYSGSHTDGFRNAVMGTIRGLIREKADGGDALNILPGFLSPADIRHLKEIVGDFGIEPIILPDISETLDGVVSEEYQPIPPGGTTIEAVRRMSGSLGTVEFGRVGRGLPSGGKELYDRFGVALSGVGTPIGLRESDAFFKAVEELSHRPVPEKYRLERGRLIDSFIDGHKYVFGKRAVVYGDEDMAVGIVSFLAEIGINPVLVATGSSGADFGRAVQDVCRGVLGEVPQVLTDTDFHEMAETAEKLSPDLIIGHSKGYAYARKWNIPLIRVGFPIHDRFGAQRRLSVGYRGTQELFDSMVNALIEHKQHNNDIGYGYY